MVSRRVQTSLKGIAEITELGSEGRRQKVRSRDSTTLIGPRHTEMREVVGRKVQLIIPQGQVAS
jgi:hypothetical protein